MKTWMKYIIVILYFNITYKICLEASTFILHKPSLIASLVSYLLLTAASYNVIDTWLYCKPKKREDTIEELFQDNEFAKRRPKELDAHALRQKAQLMNGLSEEDYAKLKMLEYELTKEV